MSSSEKITSQIKSRKRVTERGEVFTAEREVKAMCDLVDNECIRPDSRFLEPACGDGNFLAEILQRKLSYLRQKYKRSPRDYEMQSLVAIGSLYGVDIMTDNVEACKQRLFAIWNKEYTAHCKKDATDQVRASAQFILSRNIINGNALSLMCVDVSGNDTTQPIVFSEWSMITPPQMQRQDYIMANLLQEKEKMLFPVSSVQEHEGGILVDRYVTHYKKVQDYEQ